jgi:hypothetical protein
MASTACKTAFHSLQNRLPQLAENRLPQLTENRLSQLTENPQPLQRHCGKNPNPDRSDGQVHPTARSVLSHHPTVHAPRLSVHSESTFPRSILGISSKLPKKLNSFEGARLSPEPQKSGATRPPWFGHPRVPEPLAFRPIFQNSPNSPNVENLSSFPRTVPKCCP